MSTLALIRPRRVDFWTDATTDWLDGLPDLGRPASAGVRAGDTNAGVGALTVAAVDAGALEGVHLVTVTGIAGGQTLLSVTGPDGALTALGVVGLPFYGSGITATLVPVAGQPPPAIGDSFALSVLQQPFSTAGLVFRFRAHLNPRSASVMLEAASDADTPTLVNGGMSDLLGMRLLQPAMARCPVGDFPHAITATDPATGRTVPAYLGTLHHRALPTLPDPADPTHTD